MDTGDAVVVDAPTLFGRDPAAENGEDVQLRSVADPSRSLSKTHLLLTPTPAGITVTDRHSTNGVLIRTGERSTACVPGVPELLQLPAALQIGTRSLTISALDDGSDERFGQPPVRHGGA